MKANTIWTFAFTYVILISGITKLLVIVVVGAKGFPLCSGRMAIQRTGWIHIIGTEAKWSTIHDKMKCWIECWQDTTREVVWATSASKNWTHVWSCSRTEPTQPGSTRASSSTHVFSRRVDFGRRLHVIYLIQKIWKNFCILSCWLSSACEILSCTDLWCAWFCISRTAGACRVIPRWYFSQWYKMSFYVLFWKFNCWRSVARFAVFVRRAQVQLIPLWFNSSLNAVAFVFSHLFQLFVCLVDHLLLPVRLQHADWRNCRSCRWPETLWLFGTSGWFIRLSPALLLGSDRSLPTLWRASICFNALHFRFQC